MRALSALCLVAALGVVPSPADPPAADPKPADPRAEFFKAGKVVRLDLTVDRKDLDALGRDPRKYVPAALTEDGKTTYEKVGVHLRGSAGSYQDVGDKPGLTLNLDKFTAGQRFHGMEKVHLHNSVQDPTYVQELLCGELFRAAGVPASRIGHAVVTLNGRKLGLYYLKEGYDAGFRREHFGRADGNFYDGGFLRDIDQPLQLLSGGNDVADHADLKALVAAARDRDKAARFRKLEQLLDLDQFLALVALEVVLWDWDGYPMKPNNYRVYHDPGRDKITFVPSGMDQMFADPDGPLFPEFGGLVARKLLDTPRGRELYLAKVAEVMDKVYKPDALLRRLDELRAVVQPALAGVDAGAGREYPDHLRRLREAIPHRAKNVAEQLKQLDK
ncbi:MAG: CotH kinase family protein [Gemmataceae bacterium]|nr:CotH kinase family protein [Gemmataceae bacterium]